MNAAEIQDRRDSLCQFISDASKDAWGFRTREDLSGHTLVQLGMVADFWVGQVEISMNEEERAQERAIAEFEGTIACLIENGAGDRATALRWFKDSMKEDGYGVWYGEEGLLVELGLPFNYGLESGARDKYAAAREAALA